MLKNAWGGAPAKRDSSPRRRARGAELTSACDNRSGRTVVALSGRRSYSSSKGSDEVRLVPFQLIDAMNWPVLPPPGAVPNHAPHRLRQVAGNCWNGPGRDRVAQGEWPRIVGTALPGFAVAKVAAPRRPATARVFTHESPPLQPTKTPDGILLGVTSQTAL
jgi:hypothetical protein